MSFLNNFYQFIEICPEHENTEALYAIIYIKWKLQMFNLRQKNYARLKTCKIWIYRFHSKITTYSYQYSAKHDYCLNTSAASCQKPVSEYTYIYLRTTSNTMYFKTVLWEHRKFSVIVKKTFPQILMLLWMFYHMKDHTATHGNAYQGKKKNNHSPIQLLAIMW